MSNPLNKEYPCKKCPVILNCLSGLAPACGRSFEDVLFNGIETNTISTNSTTPIPGTIEINQSNENETDSTESSSTTKLKRPIIIIINGKGGVGKDTLCNFAKEWYRVKVISSITPIVEIAKKYGYTGKKTLKERKFLSDLKDVFTEFNDLPFKYLTTQITEFLASKQYDVLFVHIREPKNIRRLKEYISSNFGISCITMLVKRGDDTAQYGNHADDDVLNYNYDKIFDNNYTLSEANEKFHNLMSELVKERGIS